MKNVPGRRTDWHECQWLQSLPAVGLLRAAFRPEPDVTAVRTIMRHCHELVQMSDQPILATRSDTSKKESRLDEQSFEFHEKPAYAYHELVLREPRRFRLIDGHGRAAEMAAKVWCEVAALLNRKPCRT
jgi:thymidylate kinase